MEMIINMVDNEIKKCIDCHITDEICSRSHLCETCRIKRILENEKYEYSKFTLREKIISFILGKTTDGLIKKNKTYNLKIKNFGIIFCFSYLDISLYIYKTKKYTKFGEK